MKQHSTDLFTDDREIVVFRSRSSRRPLLAAVPLTILLAAVVTAGIAGGNHSSGRAGIPDRSDRAAASGFPNGATPPLDYAGTTPINNTAPLTSGEIGVNGLPDLLFDKSDLHSAGLGSDSVLLAVDKGRVLSLGGNSLYLTDMTGPAPSSSLIQNVGGPVLAAAMHGDQVIYSEIVPALPADTASDCASCQGGDATRVGTDWAVVILDMSTDLERQVASGTMPAEAPAAPGSWPDLTIPHVAVSDTLYAFSIPSDSVLSATTVEVHQLADDSKVTFNGSIDGKVAQLLRTDDRIVGVALFAASDPAAPGLMAIYSVPFGPGTTFIGFTNGPVSLSADGKRIAYASCDTHGHCKNAAVAGPDVSLELTLPYTPAFVAFDSGNTTTTTAWAPSLAPYDPDTGTAKVGSPLYADLPTNTAPFVAIWNATYPGGAEFVGTGPAIWMAVQGDLLIWAQAGQFRSINLYAVDLATANLHK